MRRIMRSTVWVHEVEMGEESEKEVVQVTRDLRVPKTNVREEHVTGWFPKCASSPDAY